MINKIKLFLLLGWCWMCKDVFSIAAKVKRSMWRLNLRWTGSKLFHFGCVSVWPVKVSMSAWRWNTICDGWITSWLGLNTLLESLWNTTCRLTALHSITEHINKSVRISGAWWIQNKSRGWGGSVLHKCRRKIMAKKTFRGKNTTRSHWFYYIFSSY